MLLERTSLGSKLLVCAGLVVYLYLCAKTMTEHAQVDFFIFRTGSQLALDGFPPYVPALVQARVADQFRPEKEDDVANQCGFFLPPQAIVFFLPFAKMDWWQAQGLWFFFLTGMGILAGLLAYSFGRARERQGRGWALIAIVVLLNPITLPTMVVGQTGLLFLGCIAMGQYAFENECPRLGTFLWSITFIKPHIALPFLILAWVLGGWRRAAGIMICVALWNLCGGLIVTGNVEGAIRFFRFYVEFVGAAHKTVKFNLVAENFQILSWNRMLVASGGPAVDLKIWMTLTGFFVWGLLIYSRMRLGTMRLDQAYLVAATAVGALLFAQVLAYEMILLAFVAPLILQHFDANRKRDAYVLIALLLFLMLPMNLTDQLADRFGFEEMSRPRILMRSHKCFGIAALAIWLLIRGPAASNMARLISGRSQSSVPDEPVK